MNSRISGNPGDFDLLGASPAPKSFHHEVEEKSNCRAACEALDRYNRDRPHSSINDRTPDEAYRAQLKKAA